VAIQRTFSADAGQISSDPGRGPDTIEQDFDNIINVLNKITDSTTDGDSGADNVSMTAIAPFVATKLQAFLEELVARLQATTDGSSGADLVGATAISGLSGSTVQSLLEALKNYIDTHKTSDDHDSRYYTESEVDAIASDLAGAGRTTQTIKGNYDNLETHKGSSDHDSRYFTKTEIGSTTDGNSGADKVGAAEVATGSGQTVQAVLEWLYQEIINVTLGQIPDGSLTDVKLSNDANDIKQRFATHLAETVTQVINVKTTFGAKGDGITDDTVAFQNAINQAAQTKSPIFVPPGVYKITSTLQINSVNLMIIGSGRERDYCTIQFNGSGPLFQLDEDNGQPWNANLYDGKGQGFTLRDIHLRATPDTSLNNGLGEYRAGTYAIRDWRGGSVRLKNVWIENFDHGFWGVQSDINYFEDVMITYCKVGIYLGPRSNQFTLLHGYTFFNDTALYLDTRGQSRFIGCQFVVDGSQTDPAIRIACNYVAWGSPTEMIEFSGCWFEHAQSVLNAVNDYILIESTQGEELGYIIFDHPFGTFSVDEVDTFLKITTAAKVEFRNLNTYDFYHNVTTLVKNNSSANPWLTIFSTSDVTPKITDASGTLRIHHIHYRYDDAINLISKNGRFYLSRYPSDTERDLYISSEYNRSFCVTFPNTTTGNTRLLEIRKRMIGGTAAPTSGDWIQGDIILNMSPTELGDAGSKYVVLGWVCIASGTPGTWVEMRCLTGN